MTFNDIQLNNNVDIAQYKHKQLAKSQALLDKQMDMKKRKIIINILLAVLTVDLVLVETFTDSQDISQILNVAATVIGFWLIMRMFNIKPLTTKER